MKIEILLPMLKTFISDKQVLSISEKLKNKAFETEEKLKTDLENPDNQIMLAAFSEIDDETGEKQLHIVVIENTEVNGKTVISRILKNWEFTDLISQLIKHL